MLIAIQARVRSFGLGQPTIVERARPQKKFGKARFNGGSAQARAEHELTSIQPSISGKFYVFFFQSVSVGHS